jgi:N-methylhydantoinase B
VRAREPSAVRPLAEVASAIWLRDAEGDSAAQGNQDIAVHVGTLHFTCKDVMPAFASDLHPGDVYALTIPMPARPAHCRRHRTTGAELFVDGGLINL